jgi:hypothetical protein
LEYAVPVWQSIPGILSDKLETIQKRALKIIFPSAETYLQLAGIDNLADRRIIICKKYMNKMKRTNHPLHALLPKARTKTVIMSLETKPKKFLCIKVLSSVELKRQKTFLPSNIINILIDLFEACFHYFYCKLKLNLI